VVVGAGEVFLPGDREGSEPPDAFADQVGPGGFGREVEANLAAGAAIVARRVNRRSRNRFGSQRLAWCPFRASICIHPVISTARATMAHQILFWSNP